jgi:hypothetical protein
MKLSDRLRPNSEAAPWVVEEVKKLEKELADAYLELRKLSTGVIFDREVWERARSAGSRCELVALSGEYGETQQRCTKPAGHLGFHKFTEY